ncbi:hypothetical protein L3Q82_005205 [Scortum barcoo]|uniref:Uncharacterized protein n=1 Tax=Scortum barcoo TaxID=214431 RepID=A0ACB8VA80_9TELE|nr:hypothetical protein L3Q82_005205 [Scortum barcoo]
MDRLGEEGQLCPGMPLDSVEVVGNGRMMAKLSSLLNNTSHPLQDTLTALGSSFSERLLHPRCVKESFHVKKKENLKVSYPIFNPVQLRGASAAKTAPLDLDKDDVCRHLRLSGSLLEIARCDCGLRFTSLHQLRLVQMRLADLVLKWKGRENAGEGREAVACDPFASSIPVKRQ